MLAGFGVVISSALTLVIFFPRSIETEIRHKEATRERRMHSTVQSRPRATIQTQSLGTGSNLLNDDEGMKGLALTSDTGLMSPSSSKVRRWEDDTPKLSKNAPRMVNLEWAEEDEGASPGLPNYTLKASQQASRPPPPKSTLSDRSEHGAVPRTQALRPNRRVRNGDDVELGGIGHSENNIKFQEEKSNVSHLVHNFKSPIGTF